MVTGRVFGQNCSIAPDKFYLTCKPVQTLKWRTALR